MQTPVNSAMNFMQSPSGLLPKHFQYLMHRCILNYSWPIGGGSVLRSTSAILWISNWYCYEVYWLSIHPKFISFCKFSLNFKYKMASDFVYESWSVSPLWILMRLVILNMISKMNLCMDFRNIAIWNIKPGIQKSEIKRQRCSNIRW